MLNPITIADIPPVLPIFQRKDNKAEQVDKYSDPSANSVPSAGPTNGDEWTFNEFFLCMGFALVAASVAGLRARYRNLKVEGEGVGGLFALDFPDVVLNYRTGLKIFYRMDDLFAAWKKAEIDVMKTSQSQDPNSRGEDVVTITHKPWGVNSSLTTTVTYIYLDGELRRLKASRRGGILRDTNVDWTPDRELPPVMPPNGKKPESQVVEIGDEAVALKVHELARGEGEEIKTYLTVGDFRLAMGEPVRSTWGETRTTWWRTTGDISNGERVILEESTTPSAFFVHPTGSPEKNDQMMKDIGTAYSTAILEVAYDMDGNRVQSLEPGKRYRLYQVRYNYGRDDKLIRTVILEDLVELTPMTSRVPALRRSIESKAVFTNKPADTRRYSDSSAASDRADVAAAATGERDMSAVVSKISEWLEIAYKRVKSGELMNASGYFLRIANHAKYEGLKVIEAVARVAAGDMSVMRDHPCNFVDAAAAYSAALSVLEGKEFREAAKTVAALKGEAMLVENTQIVRDIWDEMRPEAWLFRDPLAQLEGGVASETSGPTVPPPEIARAGEAVGRAEALRTRREFLDAFRAAERARKSAAEMAKKR